MEYSPTRAAGLAVLDGFIDRAGRDYAATRNYDHGPGDRTNVSMLSRYVRYRLVTEQEAVAAVRARHPGESAAKFIDEMLWRTYWKGWLQLRPSVWTDYLSDLAALEAQSGGWRRDYDRALAGGTGIDCFDAWIGELTEHGYLHNHARMWFASIWIFTLRLPWQLGAALFHDHLYDGDPASNTLSWRWVAGLQTAGKTYLATADNITRYTDGRFAPAGLATRTTAVAGKVPPLPLPLEAADPVPGGRVGLLLAEDDLAPESLMLGKAQVAVIASIGGAHGRAPDVEAFVGEALGDARRRAATKFSVDAAALADPGAVGDWADAHGLDHVVVGYAPVGPGATAIAAMVSDLGTRGIRTTRVRRGWDDSLWPTARRGFFAFRKDCASLV